MAAVTSCENTPYIEICIQYAPIEFAGRYYPRDKFMNLGFKRNSQSDKSLYSLGKW